MTWAGAANPSTPPAVGPDLGPLPPGDAPELALSEFVTRLMWDGPTALAERDVSLTGFVVRRGDVVELARMVITCCAADAPPDDGAATRAAR